MSLINDALKRAKQTQQQQPPGAPGGPPLRPVEQPRGRHHNVWLMLLFTLVVAAASILLWQWFQQGRPPQPPIVVDHSTSPAQPAPTQTPPQAGTPEIRAASSSPVTPIAVTTSPAPVEPKPTQLQPPESSTAPATDIPSSSATNISPGHPTNAVATTAPTVQAVEAIPPLASLKLQGILFHPSRPSAVVNGKLLFVGDRLGAWRVIAIEPQSVALVNGGKTNYLTLD